MQDETKNNTKITKQNLSGWNDEARAIAGKILEAVKSSHKILLHCHPSPDPDSVGSTLAMKLVLEGMGKTVTAIGGDSVVPHAYSHMPGFADIQSRNITEVDLNQFDLFIAQDSGSIDMVSKISTPVIPESLKVIVIDHHATNTHYGNINLVIPSIPANCAVLTSLFREWGISFSRDLARCLYFGMYSDTGGFKYDGISSHTFECAAYLASVDRDMAKFFSSDISKMENSNTKEAIFFSGLGLSKRAIGITDIQTKSGKVLTLALSLITNQDMVEVGITRPEDMASHSVIGALRSVEQFDIVISAAEKELGSYKMSIRTKSPDIDAGAIAMKLGGGGHKGAAGASLSSVGLQNTDEIRKKIINAVESYLCSTE